MPSMVTGPEYVILLIGLALCCIAGLVSGVLSFFRSRKEMKSSPVSQGSSPSNLMQ
jgi:hypothetical protein